ncbi:helix-turn-helix domain-containing protein [Crossiella sp. SN42]|uniref:helix-turn-helix domain-containing protein n=1 Tax=Crossiella sp. SN42 TaxID=2944808 RepID=UPI00207C11EF|nr:helix-turn-helix domain-containing protein [Crossiella sp. SN42]MCO1575335.1 helix-turn-helix domain-containing protein [Crossiella sp. SN42]
MSATAHDPHREYSYAEAAARLGRSVRTIQRYIANGDLVANRGAGRPTVSQKHIDDFRARRNRNGVSAAAAARRAKPSP